MQRKTTRADAFGYVALVAVIVAGTISLGGVVWQVTESGGAHVHGPAVSTLAIGADVAGGLAMFLLAGQLMVGYRLIRVPRPRFRKTHIATGWTVAVMLGLHGVSAAVHSFAPPREIVPFVLDAIGVTLVVLVGVQLGSGYRCSMPKRPRARALHAAAAVALAIVVAGHSLLGVYHVLTG